MMQRQPDGTWRNTRRPMVTSSAVLRARWVEAEVLRLKTMGLSFEEIAEQITRVGLGKSPPLVAIPPEVTFPDDYAISRQACHKAFKKAIARHPALEVEELRKLDNARSEEMFLNLQPGIRKGNLRAIEVGVKVLDHSARINGHSAPQRRELTGKDGKPLTLVQLLEAVGPIPEDGKP
jgi:hypothetical protein